MRSRAAIVREVGGDWSVEEFELDPPRTGEVLLQMAAAGLCHSDDHIRAGQLAAPKGAAVPVMPPTIGGHEGSAVVLEVGPGVTRFSPGDHVVTSFLAVCGKCRWCTSGMEYLCDVGAGTLIPGMPTDGTFRHHSLSGEELRHTSKIGAFAEHTVVAADSLVKIDPAFTRLAMKEAFAKAAMVSCVKLAREVGYALAGTTTALWLAVVGWSLWAANSPGLGYDATRVTYSGIVDERRFYSQATGHAHPLTAADYLDSPRMRAVLVALNNTPDGALLLPSGNYDVWDVVPAMPPPVPPREHPYQAPYREKGPATVFFTNLGMVGMNVGLNTRVIDQIGLANPLAAHTARLEDARIGHDKNLFPDWAVAEGPWLKERPYVPQYLDEGWIREAQAALQCEATEAMLDSIRKPLGVRRFLSNVLHAADFTRYRIDRVPQYELRRCGLGEPPLDGTPYTGLPATGP